MMSLNFIKKKYMLICLIKFSYNFIFNHIFIYVMWKLIQLWFYFFCLRWVIFIDLFTMLLFEFSRDFSQISNLIHILMKHFLDYNRFHLNNIWRPFNFYPPPSILHS
jgi:hypothetical protein